MAPSMSATGRSEEVRLWLYYLTTSISSPGIKNGFAQQISQTEHLNLALQEFVPDLVVYNAGTDILEGDPLGCLSITAEGVIQRDEIVFQTVRARKIPIVMLTSGGYLKKSAKIIASSIMNLHHMKLITGPDNP